MRLAAGIDVHKEKCALYAVLADQREPTAEEREFLDSLNTEFRRFPSNIEGMQKLAQFLGEDHEVGILIENSSKSHDVYWMLTGLGYDVVVAHATDLHLITKSKTKNDDHDARKLAGYMRRRMNGEIEFAESFIVSKEWMQKRELSRIMAQLRTTLSVMKKKVRAHLLLNGQHTSREYDDISSGAALKELKGFNDAALRYYVAEMEHSKKMIRMMEKTLIQIFNGDRMFDIIYSIPGFGVHSAAYLVSQIVDIGRFPKKTDLAGYAGLRPMQRDSADSHHNCCISRRGDALLRRLVYQATFVHVNNCENSFITRKYQRLKAHGKHHKEATVACANSMLMLVWTLITDDRLFEADPQVSARARACANALDLNLDDEELDDLPEDVIIVPEHSAEA